MSVSKLLKFKLETGVLLTQEWTVVTQELLRIKE